MSYQSYHIESFGCQMNQSDSERIGGQLEMLGCSPVDQPEQADIIVINTCCVRESAENRIFGHIGALKRLKQQKSDVLIIVAGCMAQKDQDSIFRRAPHVDLVLGTQNIDRLAEILTENVLVRKKVASGFYDADGMNGEKIPRHEGMSAWIPIIYGCDNFCSYCIVPYVRGRERSRPASAILQEVAEFAGNGGKEITLLGQNVNSYGKNLPGDWNFSKLLAEISIASGIERIRFMTSHPKDFSDDLLQVMAQNKNICAHLHLPVQSGCDETLRLMNRCYTVSDYRRHVEKLRTTIPEISLTTDLIVGFPGETDGMFEETLNFVQEIQFDSAFTFLYSRRSGTPAADMEPQVPPAVKKDRLKRLMAVQSEISHSANKRWLNRTVEVLADGPSKTNPAIYSGRTSQNKIVLWPSDATDRPGRFRNIQIVSTQTYLLRGVANDERNEMIP